MTSFEVALAEEVDLQREASLTGGSDTGKARGLAFWQLQEEIAATDF